MIAVLRSDEREPRPIKLHAVEVSVVDVAAWFPALTGEEDLLVVFIDSGDVTYRPRAGRNLVLQVAFLVEPVNVRPAVTLRPPEHVIRIVAHPPAGWVALASLDERLGRIPDNDPIVARVGVYLREKDPLRAPREIRHIQFVGGRRPS